MKYSLIALTVIAFLFQSCRKAEISSDLTKSKWVEQGGSNTIEFGKRWVKVNDEKINDKGEVVHVEGGQIWLDKDGELTYLYDYKLSGTNLFVMSETTSLFVDPSFDGLKYKQE